MSTELEWVVEYETLPPDEPSLAPPSPERNPRRRRPRWLLPVLGLVAVIIAILAWLWLLGGKADPLPNPDPPQTRLEATVRLEIQALVSDDETIWAQQQADSSRRRDQQPPPEAWFESGQAGPVELIKTDMIDDDSALAEIKLTWQDRPYRLMWFYHLDPADPFGSSEPRWWHTDWEEIDLGPTEHLQTPHFRVSFHQKESQQITALTGALEAYAAALCDAIPCPTEPFQASIEVNRFLSSYQVQGNLSLEYRIPSPVRIRWPCDNQPEPVLMASLVRNLAYDLSARPTLPGLEPQNQVALTLATHWLAHHLLQTETPPSTRWLDRAVELDGLPAALTFLAALRQNVPPHEALAAVFQPETVESVSAMPDYFGWLVLVTDPAGDLHGRVPYSLQGPFAAPWHTELPVRLDRLADPWARPGEVYRRAAPQVSQVEFADGWALASTSPGNGWLTAYYLRQADDGWQLGEPDETLIGQEHTVTTDRFALTYRTWDQPFLAELLRVIELAQESTVATFALKLAEKPTYVVDPTLDPFAPDPAAEPGITRLVSPARLYLMPDLATDYRELIASMVVSALVQDQLAEITPEAEPLAQALFRWQFDQVAARIFEGEGGFDTGSFFATVSMQGATASGLAGHWQPLVALWVNWDSPVSEREASDLMSNTWLLISYLIDHYGTSRIPAMLDAFRSAPTISDWILAVTGQPLDTVEAEWHAWVEEHYPAWQDQVRQNPFTP